jgi:hypothetical protein
VRLRATTVGELPSEVDGAVEAERAIIVDVNVQRLEVGGSVDDTDIAGLNKVVGDDYVLLVGSDLDVVGSDGGLILIGVVKTLDVVQVGDVEGSNVVGGGEGDCSYLLVSRVLAQVIARLTVCELAVGSDVRVDGHSITSLWSQVVEELSFAELAISIFPERIDDPNLAQVNSSGDGSRLLVAWDELDILNATTVGNGNGVGDRAIRKPPETKSVGSLDTKSRLENGDRNDKIRGKDQILLEIDRETVG